MKNKNKQIVITSLVIISLLLVTLGVSYSFFSYIKEGQKENSVKLGSITFKYTENKNLGNGISITDAFPMSDEEGKKLEGEGKVFDFKVEANLSRSDLEYEVVAEPTENSTLPLDAIKFYLTEITDGTEKEISDSINALGSVKTLDEYNDTEIKNATGKTVYREKILKNTKGYLKQFRARMWIKDGIDWTDDGYIGTSGAIRINVYANSDRSTAAAEPTNPEDTNIERVTANNQYLFTNVSNEEYQYTVAVPNEVDIIDISVIPTSTEATVEISQIRSIRNYSLQVGENFFRAKVTSANKEKSQEYILRVIREQSRNTDLEKLEVVGYNLNPSYTSNKNIYKVEVPYETTSVEIITEKKEEVQTVTGAGIYELALGTNEAIIEVKAENGTVRTIRITIERKKSDDASIDNVEVNGYKLTHLESNIYTLEVPYEIANVTINNVTVTGASVTGIGEKILKVGSNDYSVEVTSASGQVVEKYIIRVIRKQDTDNTLKSLSLTSCTLSPTFSSSTTSYTCTVENNVEKTTVSAEATSSVATVSGTGNKTLNVGDNTVSIVVTAQDGSTKTYTVIIHRKSNDASLSALSVTGYTISPTFASNITAYTLTVPYNVTRIIVNASVNSSEASVSGTGEKELIVGENSVNIIVTAEDGTTKTYLVTVTRKPDTDNSLKSLSLTDCTLSPTFVSETTSYTCTVENSITKTTVAAETISSVATVSGTGEKNLNVGANTIKVVATAQNGSAKTYTIIVTRLPNTDASLKKLEVSGQAISPAFNKETLVYTLSIPYSIDNITITGEATKSVSSVDGLGNKVLTVGENSFDIKVTAEDGITTRTYRLTVTREKDTDSSLKNISITGYNIVKVDNNNYTLTVENNVTSVEVNAEATSSAAIITGTGNKTLNVGANTVQVVVTAQNGTISTYNIVVTRKASSDATLKALSVIGYAISPTFASATTSYTLTVPYSVSNITVNATVNSGEANVTGTGNKTLNVGSNTISIVVTAGDKTTKTYTITVTREKDTDNTLKGLSLTGCTLSPTFVSGTTNYTCTVANSVTKTTVSAEKTSRVATISGTGSKTLNVGDNTVNVVVTAQDGSTKTYTVTIHRKSNDASLSALSVTGQTISPTFASNTTAYTLTVPNATSSITVNATKNHSKSTISGTGSKTLSVGNNTIIVKVTAEDGNTKNYTITVKRMGKDTITLSAKNTTYTGSIITANTATATSGTNITYTYYSTTNCSGTALANAPTNVGSYSVKAISTGNADYEPGSKCVAHTITKGTPTISLKAKSTEATGSTITANTATAKNPNNTAVTLAYSYTYYNGTSCSGTALSGAPSAVGSYSVKATSIATSNLNVASSSCVTHTINKNTNANLSSLSVTGYSISPTFAAATTSYTLTVEASSVTVNAKAASSLSTVSGTGSKTLNWGSNEFSVIVTAQSGDIKIYKIIITSIRPTAPTITGGTSTWVSTAPTIKVSKAGTAISGVKHYEYYKSASNATPSDSTAATGTTSGNVTVSDEGTTYIWYRTVSNNGFKSAWSSPQVTKLRTNELVYIEETFEDTNYDPNLTKVSLGTGWSLSNGKLTYTKGTNSSARFNFDNPPDKSGYTVYFSFDYTLIDSTGDDTFCMDWGNDENSYGDECWAISTNDSGTETRNMYIENEYNNPYIVFYGYGADKITIDNLKVYYILAAPTVTAKVGSTSGNTYVSTGASANIYINLSHPNSSVIGYQYSTDYQKTWINLSSQPLILNNEGTYSYIFRGITNAGETTAKSNYYSYRIDKTKPTIVSTNISGSKANFTIKDNLNGSLYYCVTTSSNSNNCGTTTTYGTTISSANKWYRSSVSANTNKNIQFTGAMGNYYLFVKDSVGNITSTSFSNIVNYAIGDIIYFNPENNTLCTDYDSSQSNLGVTTGCMKWYVLSSSSSTVTLLLDHVIGSSTYSNLSNTLKSIDWSSTANLPSANLIVQAFGKNVDVSTFGDIAIEIDPDKREKFSFLFDGMEDSSFAWTDTINYDKTRYWMIDAFDTQLYAFELFNSPVLNAHDNWKYVKPQITVSKTYLR